MSFLFPTPPVCVKGSDLGRPWCRLPLPAVHHTPWRLPTPRLSEVSFVIVLALWPFLEQRQVCCIWPSFAKEGKWKTARPLWLSSQVFCWTLQVLNTKEVCGSEHCCCSFTCKHMYELTLTSLIYTAHLAPPASELWTLLRETDRQREAECHCQSNALILASPILRIFALNTVLLVIKSNGRKRRHR